MNPNRSFWTALADAAQVLSKRYDSGVASYVIDANPVATLVTKVKTAGLDKDTRASIEQLITYVEVPRNAKKS